MGCVLVQRAVSVGNIYHLTGDVPPLYTQRRGQNLITTRCLLITASRQASHLEIITGGPSGPIGLKTSYSTRECSGVLPHSGRYEMDIGGSGSEAITKHQTDLTGEKANGSGWRWQVYHQQVSLLALVYSFVYTPMAVACLTGAVTTDRHVRQHCVR